MKARQRQIRVIVDSILTIALMTAAISIPGMAQTSPVLSKKDVNAILKSATTAQEHQELATYYREQASHLSAESQRFAKQADFMDTQSKRGTPCTCAAPYRHLSNEYATKARQAEASAVQQDELSQKADKIK
jgi:hypothetical protein